MMPLKHYDAAAAMVDRLLARKRALGLSDAELGRRVGSCHSTTGKWRTQERQPLLRSIMAIAEALDMEIVLRERQR